MSIRALARPLGVLAIFVLVASFAGAQQMVSAPPAQAAAADSPLPGLPNIPGVPGLNPCDLLSGTAKTVCQTVTDPVGAANSAIGDIPGVPTPSSVIGDAASSVGNTIATSILSGLVQSAGATTLDYLGKLSDVLTSTSTPDILASSFVKQYELIFAMAIFVAMGLMFVRASKGIADEDLTEAGKAGAGFIAFFIAASFLPGVVAGLLKVTNGIMAPGWMDYAGQDAKQSIDSLTTSLSTSLGGDIALLFGDLIILVFSVVAGFLFEIEFLLVYILLPIVTALEIVAIAFKVGGRLSDEKFWTCTYLLIGLIFFKLIAAIVMTFGIATLAQATAAAGSVDPFIESFVILAIAPFATWAIFKALSRYQGDAPHVMIANSGAYRKAKGMVFSG